jgi:plastocyanin
MQDVAGQAGAQQALQAEKSAQVQIVSVEKGSKAPDLSGAVMWLSPLSASAEMNRSRFGLENFRLTQKNKSFQPHVLIIPVGATVEFPNEDPFFHNVFSLFNGKRFDLGLYETGAIRHVHFDRPGICYIFCNIHPEMSAVVIVLNTPYFGVSDARGNIGIQDVPPGRYRVVVWQERSDPDELRALSRDVNLTAGENSLGTFSFRESPVTGHKNKYGRDYDTSTPPNSIYVQP